MEKPTDSVPRKEMDCTAQAATLSLPVVDSSSGAVRASRTSRWRAVSLIAVHLLIIGHIVHWLLIGRTLSPVEPSEAMYTLNDGALNAGFIFFGVALAATMCLGRFVCGWGCHLVAYQDLCAWMLKRIGIKPRPFRSRILVLAPLALALYMFVWPTAYRWWVGIPAPPLTNHMLKSEFWETFPGPVIAVLTVLFCGGVMVYFLGSKGFCTYACPYGGFFALADKIAPGRIMVTDACQHCGHCTATCTSNVRVGEEVALYGMVVDPGCMKCMDCVSVCPNDALYFGFTTPPFAAKPPPPALLAKGAPGRSARRSNTYDFSLREEGLMAVIGLTALLIFRGLYGQIPLLLAMGMAGTTAYLFVKVTRLVRTPNVRLQNLQLKRDGRLTRRGLGFATAMALLLVFTIHSGAVQYHSWRGRSLLKSADVGDEVWFAGNKWWAKTTPDRRARVAAAMVQLEWVDRWGLLSTPAAMTDLVWLYLAQGHDDKAEDTMRRIVQLLPDQAKPCRGMAGVLRKTGRIDEAEEWYREAVSLNPSFAPARDDLAAMLYAHGMLLLELRHTEEAIQQLESALEVQPKVALYHYNLGVAVFMAGRPGEALSSIREAIRLQPDDPDAHGFLAVVLRELGDIKTAQEPIRPLDRLRDFQANTNPDDPS